MVRNRLLVRRQSRAARKGEGYITDHRFPAHIEARVRRRFPQLGGTDWDLVEQGLREWFVCCAWRGRTVLGMPSRIVDEAWHEFILDSLAYTRFCQGAFDGYLHHTPDEAMSMPMGDALADTVRAWDRSEMGAEAESILWDLDERLGIEQPLSMSGLQLATARTRSTYPLAGGWACAAGFGESGGGGGAQHHGHGGCGGGGGCSAGGGCGGGGCGGGGCGGGGGGG